MLETREHNLHGLNVFECYSEAVGGLRPVVALHGLGVSTRHLLPFLSLLANERCVYAIDLPGCGRSSRPRRPFGITDFATVVIDWMSSRRLSGFALFGNSMGCEIAA